MQQPAAGKAHYGAEHKRKALETFSTFSHCLASRRKRLETVNRTQRDAPPVRCAACGGS